jgi:hypothetical protein
MKHRWFRPWGWIYLPISWQGFVVSLMGLAFCLQVFVAVDSRSHSISDTLYGIFPYVIPCLMILNWIASKTARLAPVRTAPDPVEGASR